MPEESTYESMGLYLDPNFDVYENVLGMDAHAIPFPNDSFNTVITNDLLSYGVDRRKIIRELVRVQAPGGTIFLSETSGNINKYPNLLAELRKVVPTADMLDDPVAFYRSEFDALGMVDISCRTYFDHQLCAMTYGSLHRGEVNNQIDDSKRGYYEESLRALAGILADDLAAADDGQGWQVFAMCRKPGKLSERPTPQAICLSCKATLTVTLNSCVCPQCGAHYRNELGNPYVLADYSKTYSPKTAYAPSVNMQVIENLLGRLADRLRPPLPPIAVGKTAVRPNPPISVNVFGFDKSTRFMIRFLMVRNIAVSAIYSTNPLFADHEALGVSIRHFEQLRDHTKPIVISIFCPPEDVAKLLAAECGGTVHQPDLSSGTWRSPSSPTIIAALADRRIASLRVGFRSLLAATFHRRR